MQLPTGCIVQYWGWPIESNSGTGVRHSSGPPAALTAVTSLQSSLIEDFRLSAEEVEILDHAAHNNSSYLSGN